MTTRLQTIANLAAGDALPESWVDGVMVDVNYLVVAGADIASATTINPTAEFHGVTGTTTIDTITDTAGAAAGQRVRLWIKGGPLTIRNNGGGTGNVRTVGGADRACAQNDVVTLIYDGTYWRLQDRTPRIITSAFSGGPPAAAADGDIWIATAVDANGTRWSFQYNAGSASTYKWEFIGGSFLQKRVNPAAAYSSAGWVKVASFTGLRAGDYFIRGTCECTHGGSAGIDSTLTAADNMAGAFLNSVRAGSQTAAAGAALTVESSDTVTTTTGELDVGMTSNNSGTCNNVFMEALPRRIA